jgi:hypothetical protein
MIIKICTSNYSQTFSVPFHSEVTQNTASFLCKHGVSIPHPYCFALFSLCQPTTWYPTAAFFSSLVSLTWCFRIHSQYCTLCRHIHSESLISSLLPRCYPDVGPLQCLCMQPLNVSRSMQLMHLTTAVRIPFPCPGNFFYQTKWFCYSLAYIWFPSHASFGKDSHIDKNLNAISHFH